mmetsp:Transcript_10374/g.12587  ORF Transcript_10374/g.12587 Transcript_10374/m.12587 type:complete len:438 (+) Transcript_10374:91-1404(+)
MVNQDTETSGVCLTTKGDKCWPGGLVQAVHILNAALFLAVKGSHRFIVQPNACERIDSLFRSDKRDWTELLKSVPWYEARCNSKKFTSAGSLCGENWRVPPDMHSPSSALRLLPMPSEDFSIHPFMVNCNDPQFLLIGEKQTRCLPHNFALSDMPLRKLKAQMVCGACRAKAMFLPCHTMIELNSASLIPYPDYSDTRYVLRSRFQMAMNARGLSPMVEELLKESKTSMIVTMHMPLKEQGGRFLADGQDGHDRLLAPSWWVYTLEQIVSQVYGWCIKVHIFTEAEATHPELKLLKKRFPSIYFEIHGPPITERDALIAMSLSHIHIACGSAISRLAAVLSRGVVLAPSGIPTRPLDGLRAVILAYDHRFWDRSEEADLEFWEGRSDLLGNSQRLMQLFLAQRHQGNITGLGKCLRVSTMTNCKLKFVKGQPSVSCG